MENVKNYFAEYPSSTEVLETADGFLFHKKNEGDAKNHAATLKDKEVISHLRPSKRTVVKEDDQAPIVPLVPVTPVAPKEPVVKAPAAQKTKATTTKAAKPAKEVKAVKGAADETKPTEKPAVTENSKESSTDQEGKKDPGSEVDNTQKEN